jgi:hypothetical protein
VAVEFVERFFFLDLLEPMKFAVDVKEQVKQKNDGELWS